MPVRSLPEGTALVLEGGGTRGFYSAGVFEAFMDAGIMFPYIIGVSAGAANALSYISGQPGRNRQIVEHYVADRRYVSRRNLLRYRSLFGMDFVFHEIPEKHLFWDWEMFERQDIRFLTGALDCQTGRTVWFEKGDITPRLEAVMASCSIPLLSPVVRYKGYDLLDGGVADPIPIEKSVADGNSFHVVVLTRNKGYRKEASSHRRLFNLIFRKYPKVAEAMMNRHEVYTRQQALCERLEKEGKAMIIRPLRPLKIGRSESDAGKLLALYDEGHEEGAAVAGRL
jgi:predicted patatin/cPLA2 family phospholipase